MEWALLGTAKKHDRAWHRVIGKQDYGAAGWTRYRTACELTLTGREVEVLPKPGDDLVCAACQAAP